MSIGSNPLTEYSPQMEAGNVSLTESAWGRGGLFSEDEETKLAIRLLGVPSERELDRFLDDVIRSAGKALGTVVTSPFGRAIGRVLKGVARTALPVAGLAAGGLVGGPLGAQIGSGLAAVAGRALGLELEGLSPEDREFEATKGFVRFAGEAVRQALERATVADPLTAAHEGAAVAAEAYAPGLISASLPAARSHGRANGHTTPGENIMHDIDRTQVGYGYEMESEPPTFEGGDYEDSEQAALAAELMELQTEEEFENFITDLLRRAASAVGGYISSQTGRSLGSLLKGAARQILPIVDQALGGGDAPTRGEYEGEGYGDSESASDEQEWEAATTFVKLADEAAKIAAQTPPNAAPDAVANNAVAQAAQVHAPALLGAPDQTMPPPMAPPPPPFPRAGFPGRPGWRPPRRSGRWIRSGNQILLLGV